ncbi:MAG TPA: DMT family transporter [Candidatus Cybelea sp.]|nr:DMT family transporter [Candidatus Cybelea sp.]
MAAPQSPVAARPAGAPVLPRFRPVLGAVTMLAGLAMLPGMDAIAKYLAMGRHLPPLEITWARFVFYLVAMAPFGLYAQGPAVFKPRRPGLQLVRGVLFAASAFTFFLAIARLPLADTMAVFFVYPMIILTVSALLLGERIGPLRWVMVTSGFGGALLVIRPTLSGISAGDLFALVSGAAYALGMMVTRRLAQHDPSLVTGVMSGLIGAVIYSAVVPFVWQTPSAVDWIWMVAVGAIAALGHFLLITAHRMATAAQLAPYGYAEIVSAIFFGLVVFDQLPTPMVWVGIAVIVASGLVVTWSNARLETEGA